MMDLVLSGCTPDGAPLAFHRIAPVQDVEHGRRILAQLLICGIKVSVAHINDGAQILMVWEGEWKPTKNAPQETR
jgi:hypothetical protein